MWKLKRGKPLLLLTSEKLKKGELYNYGFLYHGRMNFSRYCKPENKRLRFALITTIMATKHVPYISKQTSQSRVDRGWHAKRAEVSAAIYISS